MWLLIPFLFCLSPLTLFGDQVAGLNPLEQAKRELQAGRTDAAWAALDEAEKAGPNAMALDLRGAIYLERQKYEEAAKSFQAAHELDPGLYTPQLHFADTLLRQGKWEEARGAYEPLLKSTNILILSERIRYALLMTYLGAKDDNGAKAALERVPFPTETPAFYYAQAAWAFAHGNSKPAMKWIGSADKIFDEKKTAWFARPLYDLGWIKTKPPLSFD
jgi:tetratricopeptide (TPR) repeat protein